MSETPNTDFNLPPTKEQLADLQAQLVAAKAAEASALARAAEAETALAAADAKAAPDAEGTGSLDSQGFPAEYCRIEIYPGREKHDLGYVPLGINGYVLKIARGREVIIPKVFVKMLEQAVEEITIQSEGGLVTRPAQRFPFSVKGDASVAEYQAFRDKMRAEAPPAAARA